MLKMNADGTVTSHTEGTQSTSPVLAGKASLIAGRAVVESTAVTEDSVITLTAQSLGTVTQPTELSVSTRVPGVSFTIQSANVLDSSVIGWTLTEPS